MNAEHADGQKRATDSLPVPPAVGCLASILVGLLAVAVLFSAMRLVRDGELRYGGPLTPVRLWLVNDAGNQGVAFSTAAYSDERYGLDGVCVLTQVRFLLWRQDGSGASIEYCECYQVVSQGWQYLGSCPSRNTP